MAVNIILSIKSLIHLAITKYKIKKEIRKSLIPLDIKPKKHIYNKVSQEMEFIYI